jgi:prophage antirepressor-like protein
MIPFMLAIPIAGVLLSKPIIEAGSAWFHWAKRQPFAEWHGNYHEFAGTQIRIIEIGRELWVVDADLLRVIGEKPTVMLESLYDVHDYDTIGDTKYRGFSPSGAEKVLRKSEHYESKRMLLWLQREVYKQHRRKQGLWE